MKYTFSLIIGVVFMLSSNIVFKSFLWNFNANANTVCGTEASSLNASKTLNEINKSDLVQSLKLKFNRRSMAEQILYLPVRAHYFTCNNILDPDCIAYSLDHATLAEIQQEIDDTNLNFATDGFNVQLYLLSYQAYENNTLALGYNRDLHDQILQDDYASSGVINLFYVRMNGDSQHSNFPGDAQNINVFNRNFFNYGWSLSHELGHWFGLYHTFETTHGAENVTRDPNSSCYNCDSKGDMICDTKATLSLDFMSSDVVNGSCDDNTCQCNGISYVGNPTDNCGSSYQLDATVYFNLMNYGVRNCSHLLTQGQVDRMWSFVPFRLTNDLDLTKLPANLYCPPSLNLAQENVNVGQRIETPGTLESAQIINTSQATLYDSGNRIILKPGFKANEGAQILMTIEGCGGTKQ